jgi:hypothetical protein
MPPEEPFWRNHPRAKDEGMHLPPLDVSRSSLSRSMLRNHKSPFVPEPHRRARRRRAGQSGSQRAERIGRQKEAWEQQTAERIALDQLTRSAIGWQSQTRDSESSQNFTRNPNRALPRLTKSSLA